MASALSDDPNQAQTAANDRMAVPGMMCLGLLVVDCLFGAQSA